MKNRAEARELFFTWMSGGGGRKLALNGRCSNYLGLLFLRETCMEGDRTPRPYWCCHCFYTLQHVLHILFLPPGGATEIANLLLNLVRLFVDEIRTVWIGRSRFDRVFSVRTVRFVEVQRTFPVMGDTRVWNDTTPSRRRKRSSGRVAAQDTML